MSLGFLIFINFLTIVYISSPLSSSENVAKGQISPLFRNLPYETTGGEQLDLYSKLFIEGNYDTGKNIFLNVWICFIFTIIRTYVYISYEEIPR
jgi:hypothetical protein